MVPLSCMNQERCLEKAEWVTNSSSPVIRQPPLMEFTHDFLLCRSSSFCFFCFLFLYSQCQFPRLFVCLQFLSEVIVWGDWMTFLSKLEIGALYPVPNHTVCVKNAFILGIPSWVWLEMSHFWFCRGWKTLAFIIAGSPSQGGHIWLTALRTLSPGSQLKSNHQALASIPPGTYLSFVMIQLPSKWD